MAQPYYSIQLEKPTYSYGIDTTIKGTVIFDDLADEGDVEVELFIISGITKETVLTFEDLKDRSIIEDSDYNEDSVATVECSRENPHFSFDIKNTNLFGDIGISDDSYNTVYIHAICAGGFDLDDAMLVDINWLELDNIKLKEKELREIPEDITIVEDRLDQLHNVAIVEYNNFVSLDAYNSTRNDSRTRIGKNMYESKIFWIIYRIVVFSSPFVLSLFQIQWDTYIEDILIPDKLLKGVYLVGLVALLILRFYFITSFKKRLEVFYQKLSFIEEDSSEEDNLDENTDEYNIGILEIQIQTDLDEDSYEYNEEHLLKYFRNNIIQLKNIFDKKNINSEFPLSINGKITIGIILNSSYSIGKSEDHSQEIINKIFYEGDFSSMNSLLEKEIPIPKWVQDMANMEEYSVDLEGEIIIDITYFNGLLVNRHSISLF